MKAAIITVGDELLNGQTIDTNSAWISEQLNSIGISVVMKYAVPDHLADIVHALEIANNKADLILMTGGLGPTKDDITKVAIAKYVGDEMSFSQDTYDRISGYFNKRKLSLTEAHRQQCYMPSSAILVENPRGTAPGMWIERPNMILLSMPGVPSEMKAIMSTSALTMIQSRATGQYIEHYIIQTAGTGETVLAEMIEDIVDEFPEELSMAYLPGIASVKLRVTGKGNDEKKINQLVQTYGQLIKSRVEKYVFGLGTTTLPRALQDLCISKNIHIATAESCTGGGVSHMITSEPGSSAYFIGAAVTYSNESKKNLLGVKDSTLDTHGAVSEETVKEMVAGVIQLMQADCAIAISGIAGPGGGTPEKPVGTIWLAIGSKNHIKTRKLQLVKDRTMNIEYTIVLALNELRLFVQDNF
jgi:nicotinamide-nucleotide amidase